MLLQGHFDKELFSARIIRIGFHYENMSFVKTGLIKNMPLNISNKLLEIFFKEHWDYIVSSFYYVALLLSVVSCHDTPIVKL